MNSLKIQLFLLILSTMAHAQVTTETLSQEVDSEIEKMYTELPVKTEVVRVQKQPVTLIEATPLSNSSAEAIRKNRLEEEMKTETRIVEKLEESRMEDEKKRASILFGEKFKKLNSQKNTEEEPSEVITEPMVAPSSQIQPQPIIIQQSSLTRDDVQAEVRAALDEDKAEAEEQISLFEKKYITAVAGLPQYSNANGIQGNYSMGFALGTTNNFLQIEAGFIYSNYLINNAQYVDPIGFIRLADFSLNQYQTYVATKFQILDGGVRPNIGGLASYSFRKYVSDSVTSYGNEGTDFGQSNAIDLGLTAGLDIALGQKFSVGADLKYMFNISSNINGSTANGAKSPEKLSYYLLGLTAKMIF